MSSRASVATALALSLGLAAPAFAQQIIFTVPTNNVFNVVDGNVLDPAQSRANVRYSGKRPILNPRINGLTIDFTKCGDETITNGSCPSSTSDPFDDETSFTLTSPDGKTLTIVPSWYWSDGSNTGNRRFQINFKDGASALSTPYPTNQDASPVGGQLSSFASVDGEWTLSYSDDAGGDPLSLNSWSLVFAGDAGLLSTDIGGYSTGLASSLEFINNQNSLLTSYLVNSDNASAVVAFDENNKFKLFALGAGAQSTLNGSFYKATSYNSAYGVSYDLSDVLKLGFSYGYGTNALDGYEGDLEVQTSTFIKSTINTGSAFLTYLSQKGLQVSGVFSYSRFANDSTRANDISDAAASFGGNGYSFAGQAAQKLSLIQALNPNKSKYDKLVLKPAVALSYNGYNQDSFTELGSGALEVNYQQSSTLLGSIGAELIAKLPLNSSNYYALRPRLGAEYQANFQGSAVSSTLSAQSQVDSVVTTGVNYGANRGYFSAGLDLLVGDNVAFYTQVGYSKYLSGSDVSYGGGLSFKF